MTLKIRNIERLTLDQQQKVQQRIASVIIDTFVYPADIDYINARYMGLNHQHRPFFWPVLQAIEKYLKANFLFYGIPVKGKSFRHNICKMASNLKSHDAVLENLSLAPMGEHVELERLNLWGSRDPMEFINSIEKYGNSSNWYNFFGSKYEASYLPKLDQIVDALRSKCIGNKTLCGTGKNEAFDYAAYEQNFCFAPDSYKQGSFYSKFSLGETVPSIEAALKGLYGHANIYRQWLLDNIQITQEELDEISTR
ncbi:MAG: hypothetical protein KKE00_09015 [Proteobacteria bacterium]|nr:hypothetical protein [Pseudomonadota bacterium]MBU1570638.1 hypothetical protein [Pseudomonadota bacterium]